MRRYAEYSPTRAHRVLYQARRALGRPLRPLRWVRGWIERAPHRVRVWRSCARRRVFGAPQPPPDADYRGWRVTWVGSDSTWCRTPGDQPDLEVSNGCQGTVGEYVRPGGEGDHGYLIEFDNGATLGTYLPAPWVIQLEQPTVEMG